MLNYWNTSIILFSFIAIVVAPIRGSYIQRVTLWSPLQKDWTIFCYYFVFTNLDIWTFSEIYPSITIFAFGIFIIGIILAWLYDGSGSLLTPIIVHMFQNSWLIVYLLK